VLPATLENLLDPENIAELDYLLKYHVVIGSGPVLRSDDLHDHDHVMTLDGESINITVRDGAVFADHARVVQPDNAASNGVVHIIDQVLAPLLPPPPPKQNLLGLIGSVPELSTLYALINATALTAEFALHGHLTVFAPTNEAFAALPTGTVEHLLQCLTTAPCGRNHKELGYLLQYHLIGTAAIYYHDLHNYERIRTAAQSTEVTLVDGSPVYDVGESVEITLRSNGAVFVNEARVQQLNGPDNAAHNGVLHIIDKVLHPRKPRGNHLYFRDTALGHCGLVDAGPRMSAAVFNPNNQEFMMHYINVTVAWSWGGLGLQVGQCSELGLNTPIPCPSNSIEWAPPELMRPLCEERCNCDFPDCHGRDNWRTGHLCPLCGPRFNEPIEVQCYH
jgi:uncharacterized surface protein with fasciclin (FAS1) repeats